MTEMTAPDLRDQMAMAALTLAERVCDRSTRGECDRLIGTATHYCEATARQRRPRLIAIFAYELADAMLFERNRTTKGEDHV